MKKSLRANYRRKLSHVVVLTDGTALVTVRDAANVLLDAANARSGGLDHAVWSLLTAAETGKRFDMAEATHAIERVLRDGAAPALTGSANSFAATTTMRRATNDGPDPKTAGQAAKQPDPDASLSSVCPSICEPP
jgi:hypothetical protein